MRDKVRAFGIVYMFSFSALVGSGGCCDSCDFRCRPTEKSLVEHESLAYFITLLDRKKAENWGIMSRLHGKRREPPSNLSEVVGMILSIKTCFRRFGPLWYTCRLCTH